MDQVTTSREYVLQSYVWVLYRTPFPNLLFGTWVQIPALLFIDSVPPIYWFEKWGLQYQLHRIVVEIKWCDNCKVLRTVPWTQTLHTCHGGDTAHPPCHSACRLVGTCRGHCPQNPLRQSRLEDSMNGCNRFLQGGALFTGILSEDVTFQVLSSSPKFSHP